MNRLEKIERDMARARERIAEWQAKLKELDGQRAEQENIGIVSAVRAIGLTREELLAFIKDGALPEAMRGAASMPAARYQKKKPEAVAGDNGDDSADGVTSFSASESEVNHNEE